MTVIQPARKSYFFEKGYQDLAATIRGAWKRNMDFLDTCKKKIKDADSETFFKRLFIRLLNLVAILSVCIVGTIITALVSTLNVLVLVACMIPVYAGFTLVYLLDRAYLLKNKIFSVCPECREKSMIPTYLCPKCGARHSNLTPGVYGILHRTCTGEPGAPYCGEKLPTAFFNGRSKLQAVCPCCGKHLAGNESVPLCISVVGGSGSGKTAFITAFAQQFRTEIAPDKGYITDLLTREDEAKYDAMTAAYTSGAVRKNPPGKTDDTFSFGLTVPGKKDRQVHLYDVSGQAFVSNSETEAQKQYLYAHGIVLLLDPYKIWEAMDVLDALVRKLREEAGLRETERCKIPLAVVLSKADGPMESEIGTKALRRGSLAKGGNWNADDLHRLCKEYLRKNGMNAFLNLVDMRFSEVRYFSVSAMGHEPGREFEPCRVDMVMQWLFHKMDEELTREWKDYPMSENPEK